jgi:PAS domain S-box-containing protein
MEFNIDKMPEDREKTLTDKIAGLLKENEELRINLRNSEIRENAQLVDMTLFKSILENISSGIALIGKDGKFLMYNQEFLRLFGLSKDSTIININDQKWGEWVVYDENNKLLLLDDHPVRKAAILGKKVKNQVVGMKLPGGSDMIWMQVSAEPMKGENGEIEKIICTYQDITKNKIADENLLLNEDRLRLTLESAGLGIWDFDIETGLAFHSLLHDQIFGYKEPQPEWSYEISIKHILPEYHQVVRDSVANALKTGILYYEAQIKWPDGSIHWIAPKGRVLYNSEKKPERMLGVVSEITDQKEAERTLKENETRLRELNQTKDKFFSIIAHDLKSPFTSIMGFSELITEKINQKNYNEIDQYAKMIHRSSRHAMELLSNLFEWSRLQTGTMEFKPELINIASAVNEAIELMNYAAWHKSIRIITQLPELCNVIADKHMISSVLRNLISNALKFTYPEGKIEIIAKVLENELLITVADNGKGIDKNDLDKLFRIDVSFSTAGTSGEQGTGLGLMLSKDFLERHGGKIWAESEAGKGSRFHFTIPSKEIRCF